MNSQRNALRDRVWSNIKTSIFRYPFFIKHHYLALVGVVNKNAISGSTLNKYSAYHPCLTLTMTRGPCRRQPLANICYGHKYTCRSHWPRAPLLFRQCRRGTLKASFSLLASFLVEPWMFLIVGLDISLDWVNLCTLHVGPVTWCRLRLICEGDRDATRGRTLVW